MFKCVFPNCNYCTKVRSKIDFHHVIPKEVDNHPDNKLTVPLCKTHHALIYHPEAKYGQHSIKEINSLIIKQIFDSTDGKAILYEDMDQNQFYYFINISETVKL